MQMSANRLFVLVEGKETDPYFYSGIVRPICDAANIPCDIVRSDFVSGSGGKNNLIELYKYLHSVGTLTVVSGNAQKSCIFYLDKDIDDLMGKLISSPHLVYTPFYCAENGLFMYGDLALAAAAASSLDPEPLRTRIPDRDQWRRQKAEHWKRFLILCLLSHKLGLNCDCHYGGMASPLNAPADAPTNLTQAGAIESDLQSRSGLPAAKFKLKLRAITRYVERTYRRGLHDTLFNGKWYLEFLRREISIAAGTSRHHSPANRTLIASLSLTLNFSAQWTDHFRKPLSDLIKAASL